MGGVRKVPTRKVEAERMMCRVETELTRRVEPGENDGGPEVRLRSARCMARETKEGEEGRKQVD
jgi:hypothetical protein